MIQIIAGEKGKGKTKVLLDKVNASVKEKYGNIVYLDKSVKHMYELNTKVRLINCKDYYVTNTSEFIGFICGIISQDHDLEEIYLDSFLNIACLEDKDADMLSAALEKLSKISDMFHVDMIMSVSRNKEDLPASCHDKVIVAL
ncbi:twitching motility protein PilT [Anaerolentibacter hominis]|uniref:twitching motility protein PilT n=1 Tax=Anaerolentibacter hominis TaxID=3079009 RepID=UPI0031B81CCB